MEKTVDITVYFENHEKIDYKVVVYHGPRARGISVPVFADEVLLKDVKYGDVFCFKVTASGYYSYKKAFIINEDDIQTKEKHICLEFQKRENAGYEADSVNLWTDEVERKLFDLDELKDVDRKLLDTPAFAADKARHAFTTIEEGISYLKYVCDKCENAKIYYLDTEKKCPVIMLTTTTLEQTYTMEDTLNCIHGNHHLKILYQAQIHGNEPASGEGALVTVRKLCESPDLLENVDIIIVPYVNSYGAEYFTRFADNKKTNLNRDSLLLQSEITRKVRKLYLNLMPEVFIDGHEFCGPLHSMVEEGEETYLKWLDDIQVTCLNNLNRKQEIFAHEVEMTVHVLSKLREKGFRCFCYKPTCDNTTSCGYARIMGSYVFFIETNGIGRGKTHFERRVLSQHEAVMLLIELAASQVDIIKENVSTGRKEQKERREFVLEHGIEGKAPLELERLSYDFFGCLKGTDDQKELYFNIDTAVKKRELPEAYIIDKKGEGAEEAKKILEWNGAVCEELDPGSKVMARQYKGSPEEAFLGPEKEVHFKNGAYVFSTDQVAVNVLAASLEPDIADGGVGNGTFVQAGLLKKNLWGYPIFRQERT